MAGLLQQQQQQIPGLQLTLPGATSTPGLTGIVPSAANVSLTGVAAPTQSLTVGLPSTSQPHVGGGLTGLAGQTGLKTGQTGLTLGPGLTGLGTAQTGLKSGLGGTGQTGLTTGLGGIGQTGLTSGLGGTGQTGLTTGLRSTGQTGLTTGLGGTGQTGLTTGLGGTGQTGLTTGLGGTGQTGLTTGLGGTGQTGLTIGLGGTGQTGLTTGLRSTGQTGLTTMAPPLGTTTTAGSTVGLGGVATTASRQVTGLGGIGHGSSTKTQVKSVSEDVPDELGQLVSHFEAFLVQQKSRSESISNSSESFEKSFRNVSSDIDTHQQQATVVTQQLHQLNQSLLILKDETVKEGQVVEIAQRTRELPMGLQHENTAPDEYFQETVIYFEKRMRMYRNQLEELESYLHAFVPSSQSLGSGDILSALDAQYKPFLLLAARLQVVHEEIQRLKEQYLNMRRLMGLDNTDLFCKPQEQSKRGEKKSTESQTGPSPFAASIAQATAALTAMATAGQYGATSGIGGQGVIGGGLGMGSGLGMRTGLGTGSNVGIGMGTTSLGIGPGTSLGGGMGMGTGLGMGTSLGRGTGIGMGTSLGGIGTGTGLGLGTGLGRGTGVGMGTGLGGIGTGTGLNMGTGLGGIGTGAGLGMGTSLGGIGGTGTGIGMGTTSLGGMQGTGANTGLAVAGTTKPFQLKPPPQGKRKT